MKELIKKMVESLVDMPENVIVNQIKGQSTTVYEVTVDKTDLGKIIGKRGKTASAMRTIATAAAAKNRQRVMIEIVE